MNWIGKKECEKPFFEMLLEIFSCKAAHLSELNAIESLKYSLAEFQLNF